MGKSNSGPLPPIPPKRYFTIGEVAHLCKLQPHVLRYWEGEFPQLRPLKRDGNRRYYREHEILLIRRIRELLYEHGFTIQGARLALRRKGDFPEIDKVAEPQPTPTPIVVSAPQPAIDSPVIAPNIPVPTVSAVALPSVTREALAEIIKLLS
jgi:DNA-binding transcriptional MerR regulator